MDSYNKHYTKEDFEKRLKYLYLWDRFYLSDEEASISSAILHYLNKYSPATRKTKALTDMLTRGIKNTSMCIEEGKYLRLA